MRKPVIVLLAACAYLNSGCGGDAGARTAYETVQNMRQQECLKNLSSDCDKRDSYDEYQRLRREMQKAN
jgi:hypothetical protein